MGSFFVSFVVASLRIICGFLGATTILTQGAIVDACIKARAIAPTPRTRAIVVYPMNALANSQLEELKKFLGADVALLVRRVREALADKLICIGTSATMATDGTEMARNATVAGVATRLFGTSIPARNIVTETLKRTTPETENQQSVAPKLAAAIAAGVPENLSFNDMARHQVPVWVELTLGLTFESNKPRRTKPKTLKEAASLLAHDAGLPLAQCTDYLKRFLLCAHNVTDADGKSLFAFKLHQFISGGGKVYATLEAPGKRAITLFGQQFVAGDRSRHLYNVHFCRDCGQEYVPVWNAAGPAPVPPLWAMWTLKPRCCCCACATSSASPVALTLNSCCAKKP
ncbi:MAG: hypothetical protein COW02_07630 [Comamonadaceae bacterium CG12_big_fil_rev_8_21_14_0_65_59_15]|nr:MAG: hypothetical protein COW02_07630 [Comamonadaceae bacterium CG12_big_fil_rev_8_21_14_0_65_59_15]